MKVGIWPRAVKVLKKLPKIDQLVIAAVVRKLQSNGAGIVREKLQGYKNVYRIRVGKYRLVYFPAKTGIEIVIIGHRREVYHLLKRLL